MGNAVEVSVLEGYEWVRAQIMRDPTAEVVQVRHTGLSPEGHNLMVASRRDPDARKTLDLLTRLGYSVVKVALDITTFVHRDVIGHYWPQIRDGVYQLDERGVVYTLRLPDELPARRLLVVFSAMPDGLFATDVNRYFVQNFSTVHRYVPNDTAVLRVGDIGGVKGAFYLPTTHRPDSADAVASRIRATANQLGVGDERVVVYGASKGGTGAVFHGLTQGWSFAAIDPILDDDYYEQRESDLHFTTGGIFPRRKREIFDELAAKLPSTTRGSSAVIITASKSPQRSITADVAEPLVASGVIGVLESDNPKIAGHADVGPRSVHLQTMALNLLLSGLPGPEGWNVVR